MGAGRSILVVQSRRVSSQVSRIARDQKAAAAAAAADRDSDDDADDRGGGDLRSSGRGRRGGAGSIQLHSDCDGRLTRIARWVVSGRGPGASDGRQGEARRGEAKQGAAQLSARGGRTENCNRRAARKRQGVHREVEKGGAEQMIYAPGL